MVQLPCAYPLSAKVRSAWSWWVAWLDQWLMVSGHSLDHKTGHTDPTVAGQRRTLHGTHHRLPPLDPEHPGNGAPRPALFNCGKSIAWLPGDVKPQANPRTSRSNLE